MVLECLYRVNFPDSDNRSLSRAAITGITELSFYFSVPDHAEIDPINFDEGGYRGASPRYPNALSRQLSATETYSMHSTSLFS